jgi:hypothetical protein
VIENEGRQGTRIADLVTTGVSRVLPDHLALEKTHPALDADDCEIRDALERIEVLILCHDRQVL